MSLNCVEIQRIIAEIPSIGRLTGIEQLNASVLVFTFNNLNANIFHLFVSIEQNYNRLHLLDPGWESYQDLFFTQMKNDRFARFLKAHILQARCTESIAQIDYNRIVQIPLKLHGRIYKLIFKLWGTRANILLLSEDDMIIDSLRRYPNQGEWPRQNFSWPEAKDSVGTPQFKLRDEILNYLPSSEKWNKQVAFFYFDLILKQKKQLILNKLNKFIGKQIKSLAKSNKNVKNNFEQYLKHGYLLQANMQLLKKGMKEILLVDYETDEKILIKLDEKLSVQENIEKKFEKYKTLRRQAKVKELDKEKKQNQILTYKQIQEDLDESLSLKSLTKIYKKIFKDNESELKKSIGRELMLHNCRVIISRSGINAEKLIRQYARGNDFWFHARDYPGSHVIAKINKSEIPSSNLISDCAKLAIYYSKARSNWSGDVYMTQVKYLRKIKSDKKGKYIPTREKNIYVQFSRADIVNLLGK